MIVDYLDIFGVFSEPPETDSILIVDLYRIEACPIALQSVQAHSFSRLKVIQRFSRRKKCHPPPGGIMQMDGQYCTRIREFSDRAISRLPLSP